MVFANPQPGHWEARQSIVSMQFAVDAAELTGAVLITGDSKEEQRPPTRYSNLPRVGASGAPIANFSNVLNAGMMGIGCQDWASTMPALMATTAPSVVIIGGIGANDSLSSFNNNNPTYKAQWLAWLNQGVAPAVHRVGAANVYVEGCLPCTDGQHDNALIADFDTMLASMVDQYGCKFYNIRSRISAANGLCPDGVHLNGYGIWTRYYDEQTLLSGGLL